MYDADAIEAINFEQLATVTDRLLLRGGQVSKPRSCVPSLARLPRGSQPHLEHTAIARAVPVSYSAAPRARGSQSHLERTAVMRTASGSRVQMFAITVVIPTLVGVTVGLAALL